MPELPEVEAARRAIEVHCAGKRITECSAADDPKVLDGVSASELEAALVGRTIVAALRKGKNLWLRLDCPPFPTFQFGMAGAVYIKGLAVTKYKRSAVSESDDWPSKYSKLFVKLDDGLEFSFTDKRRFGRVRLLEDPESVPPISELGPDALSEPMPVDDFVESLSKKKIRIKGLLLDQCLGSYILFRKWARPSYISGIGNWIADEVLYQAMIHPLQIASSLSKEIYRSLHRCIREVIEYAVEVDADSKRFPKEWLFHFRWGKKAGKVNGKKIEFITAGGRTSAYVPELQKLSGNQLDEAPKRRSREEIAEQEHNETVTKSKTTEGTKKRRKKPMESENDRAPGKGFVKKQAGNNSSSNKRLKSSRVKISIKREKK